LAGDGEGGAWAKAEAVRAVASAVTERETRNVDMKDDSLDVMESRVKQLACQPLRALQRLIRRFRCCQCSASSVSCTDLNNRGYSTV
jgi:hypothetical protein